MTRHRNGGLKKRCGCPRRQWAKCSHPWHFGCYHNGREHRYSLSEIARARGDTVPTSKTEAKDLADRLRGEIRAGKNPNARLAQQSSPDVRLTFGDVSDRYLDEYVRVQSRRIDAQRVMMLHVKALKRAFRLRPALGSHWRGSRLMRSPERALKCSDMTGWSIDRAERAVGSAQTGCWPAFAICLDGPLCRATLITRYSNSTACRRSSWTAGLRDHGRGGSKMVKRDG